MTGSLSLHDSLALGEIELGLSQSQNGGCDDKRRRQEIQRLPLFLRILSLTRPLTAVPTFDSSSSSKEEEEKDSQPVDELVHRTVERLEDVAATYSMAEEVDVVTSYLAPNMSRKIGQLSPLKKTNEGEWDTKDLAAVARNPRSTRKRKRAVLSEGDVPADAEEDDTFHGDSSEEDADGAEDEDKKDDADGKKSKGSKVPRTVLDRRDSEIAAAEDSQESTFVKTLSELASLVVAALAPLEESSSPGDTGGGGGTAEGNETEGRSNKGKLSLTVDDSILNESSSAGGAMEGSDLGATLAAIMCNASVLQSRHVAYALCRAATPQAGDLMTRMGANCPASVPSLLLGCLDAYSLAVSVKQGASHGPIVKAAKQGVQALAQLSESERARVLNKLQSTNTMLDLQLKFAMELQDSTTACCFLLQHLSKELIIQVPVVSEGTKKTLDAGGAAATASNNGKRNQPQQTAGDRSSPDRRIEDTTAFGGDGKSESLVQALLSDGQNVYRAVLSFLSTELLNLAASMEPNTISIGKLLLLLKACCWTLLVPLNTASSKLNVTLGILQDELLPNIRKLGQKLLDYCLSLRKSESEEDLPKSSSFDRVMKMFFSTTVLAMTRMLSLRQMDSSQTEFVREVIDELKGFKGVSELTETFATKVKNEIVGGNLSVVISLLLSDWNGGSIGLEKLDRVLPTLEDGMKELSDLWKKDMLQEAAGESETTLDLGSRAALLMLEIKNETMKTSDSLSTDLLSTIENVLKSILCSSDCSYSLVQSEDVVQFVVEATRYLCMGKEMAIPLIMAPQLELLGTRLHVETTTDELDENQSKFMLQLLHAMEFLEQNPNSPFVIDPRTLPRKEAILLAEFLAKRCNNGLILELLEDYTAIQCPEVLELSYPSWARSRQRSMRKLQTTGLTRSEMMDLLRASIESFLVMSTSADNKDKDGAGLERIFLDARLQISDADLACTVVSAMLSSPHQPPIYLTYPKLCRDPLIVLKCPFKVWNCTGLRRMALSVLCMLLESNEAIVWSEAPMEASGEEYLAARDALVVRCLLTAMSGTENGASPLPHCSMTTSMIRLLTRRRKGIVALLVKQGLPEESLDWMVEFVPEVMNDSQDMLQMLSDQRSLTPAERLVAADAVLKIAVVQGQSNEIDAANMAYIALSQLCDALFLVAGPVGVPVNAVLEDNSALDVTQRSRKAAFRMLQTLLTVRGRRTNLRKECGLALHKLAGLCKNESAVSGVSGPVAGRRKALLKEIFDAATKATNAMGSSVGHQSVAA